MHLLTGNIHRSVEDIAKLPCEPLGQQPWFDLRPTTDRERLSEICRQIVAINRPCRLVPSKQIVGRNESRKGHWLNKACFLTGEADDNTEIRNLDIFLRHDHESRSDEGLRGDGD
jgi:hypothetical protein